MEKNVAIREWCFEKAMDFYVGCNCLEPKYSKDVLKLAKEIEKYVTYSGYTVTVGN